MKMKPIQNSQRSFFACALLCICAGLGVPASAQTEEWVARYNGPGNGFDEPRDVAIDASGNVYVTGYYATVKYDSAGNEQWAKGYGGNLATALALDSSGNVYVTGYSYDNDDYATVKYDSEGNEQWVARYNGPGNGEDRANALAVDASGNVYVTGYSWGGSTSDYATVKYDSAGNEQWVARYYGQGNRLSEARDVAIDSSNNVYVTGFSRNSGSNHDYATVKYDSAGNEQWAKRYNGPANGYDQAYALAVDASGSVAVTGYSSNDYATVKYDSAGNEQWVARYNGPENGEDAASGLALDSSGDAYVTGLSSNAAGSYYDYATVKYDSAGNQLWVARYNGPANNNDYAYALAVDASGNVYVTGRSSNGNNDDYATIKYSQPIQVMPASFTMFRGSVISGNLGALQSSDDDRLVMRPGVVFSSGEPPIQIILNATASSSSPSETYR